MDTSINQFNNILDFNVFNISKGKNGFRTFYQNIRSLKNKIDEVELLINNYDCDLIILTETWINDNEKQYYNMNHYSSIYSCRKRQGGGLGLFLHNSFDYKIIDIYESENHSCIIIKIEKLELVVVATYRPPSFNINNFLQFLDEKIDKVVALNHKCMIIGDMNINLLNDNNNTKRIMDMYSSNNFHLCNYNYPTRHSNNNHTLLDHIAVNFKEKINMSIISNSLSDHDIQLLDINSNTQQLVKKPWKKTISKINYKLLERKLNELEELSNDLNINELYNSIINSYSTCIYEKIIKTKNKSKPWFNDNLHYLIKKRDFYFQRKKVYPNNIYI